MGLFKPNTQPIVKNFPKLHEGLRWKVRLSYVSVFPAAEVLLQQKGKWFWRTVDKMDCFLKPDSALAAAQYLYNENGLNNTTEEEDLDA